LIPLLQLAADAGRERERELSFSRRDSGGGYL